MASHVPYLLTLGPEEFTELIENCDQRRLVQHIVSHPFMTCFRMVSLTAQPGVINCNLLTAARQLANASIYYSSSSREEQLMGLRLGRCNLCDVEMHLSER